MRWAALYRRPPIFRGVFASQIRADHAANQVRINARYGPALPSSPQLRGEADAAHHSAVISQPGRVERAPVVVVLDERLDLAFEVAG
jgi:hypothetical protein